MTERYAIVMAGGAGTRFWPLSRKAHPKQLLPLASEVSLLRETVARIATIVPAERVLIVTSEALAEATRRELPELPAENILAEPIGRNTAPCVGWAAATIERRHKGALMLVLPADHHIGNEPEYRRTLELAFTAAKDGALVTLGLQPSRPETGYGYIEIGEPVTDGVRVCKRFVEKPDKLRAEEFVASGTYLWNSGVFVFQTTALLSAIAEHLPELATRLATYDIAAEQGPAVEAQVVRETYGTLPSISIDHGVMEKAKTVYVVPSEFGWSDLGSWTTAWELAPKDKDGNALPASALAIETSGCFARSESGKLIAMVGVHDLVVVETKDALLVLPRERAQDVRMIVDALKAQKDGERYL